MDHIKVKFIFTSILGLLFTISLGILVNLSNGDHQTNKISIKSNEQIVLSQPQNSSNRLEDIYQMSYLDLSNYNYAFITNDDTIMLANHKGEKISINLERRMWKKLQWSTDGQLLSALGKSRDNIYDLYIFNIKTKSWKKSTDYSRVSSGVEDYIWVAPRRLFFIQGTGNDSWLHSYDYVSEEILKTEQIEGYIHIHTHSPNFKFLVIKTNNASEYLILNNLGKKEYSSKYILNNDDRSQEFLINTIIGITDDGKIIYKHDDELFGKSEIGSSLSSIIDIDRQDLLPVCTIDQDSMYVLYTEETRFIIGLLNIRREKLSLESSRKGVFNDLNDFITKCFDNKNVVIGILSSKKWYEYRYKTQDIIELEFLSSSKEVSIFK